MSGDGISIVVRDSRVTSFRFAANNFSAPSAGNGKMSTHFNYVSVTMVVRALNIEKSMA